jgi:hypothetical protein
MLNFESFEIARSAIAISPRLWGYLDPGMGSMVFQVLLAGVLSTSFFLKTWVRQMRDGLLLKSRK